MHSSLLLLPHTFLSTKQDTCPIHVVFTRSALQLVHLPERFNSRLVALSDVPAAFVRPRADGQPIAPGVEEEGEEGEEGEGGEGEEEAEGVEDPEDM